MSLSINKVKPVKIIDPVLDINSEQYYAVLKGGVRTSFKPIISTSFSNSSCTFSAPPPNPNIAVSRKVKLRQKVNIQFSGNAPAGEPLLKSQYDAFRAYPLASVTNTLDLTMNNTNFSINMNDVIHAMLRYHNPDSLKDGDMSMTPSTLDKSQQYSDLVNSIRNPLASVIDSASGALDGRGAFPITVISNDISPDIGTTINAEIEATLTEDLFLSPLLFGTSKDENGFIGLQTMQMTFNWDPDLARIWSHDSSGGTTLTTITVNFSDPTLLFEYKTPDPREKIPRFRRYPYYKIQRYTTEKASMAAGEQRILSTQNIQLNSIPRIMYIYARRSNNARTFETTDTFLSIDKVSVNWGNRSGLLSNASKQDLYEMSKRNGCNMNWRDWSGEPSYFISGGTTELISGVGSVLAIEFGTDIGLYEEEAAGINGTFQLQIDITCTNYSAAAIAPSTYVVTVDEGIFTLENNSAYSQIGVLSRSDVLDAKTMKGIDYNDLKYMAGASFWRNFARKLKHGFRRALDIAPAVIEGVKKVEPYIAQVSEIAKTLGIGYADAEKIYEKIGKAYVGGILLDGEAFVGGQYVGGAKKKRTYKKKAKTAKKRTYSKKKKGGILVGGKMVTKEELEEALYR